MPGDLKLVTAPQTEPVTYAEAKEHLRLPSDDERTLVESLIATARRHVEHDTGRALVTQTWQYALDGFPCGNEIVIPKGPLQQVTSVTYYDEDLVTETVLSASDYQVDSIPTFGVVALASGASWPTASLRRSSGVVIEFEAGYGGAAAVPEDLKHAIKLLVGQLYEHREPEITGSIVARLGFSYDALIAPYRTYVF